MHRSKTLSKILSILIITAMLLSGMSLPWAGGTQKAYAKEKDHKNEAQKQACEAVTSSQVPDNYTEVIPGKVYSGGNSYSRTGSFELDNDVTDFANPLPYGNTYIDTSKLNWNTPSNFIIDIRDDHFKWVSVNQTVKLDEDGKPLKEDDDKTTVKEPLAPLQDANGLKSTGNPMKSYNTSTNEPVDIGDWILSAEAEGPQRGIFYVGPLKSYHGDINATADKNGTTNVITPKEGEDYLYRITYLNAVTLPNGTRGNLVLTMNKVQIETSATVNEENPYTPKEADYYYTEACIKVQGENQLSNDTGYRFRDANGKELNQQTTRIRTVEEATALREAINKELTKSSEKLPTKWGETGFDMRNATGNLLDLDIEVTDTYGNPVNGTISYAAHDMDFESAQNVWGRSVGDEFAEGMTIVSGAQSYALVPKYSHDKDGLTRDKGWLPIGPGETNQLERALTIKEINNDEGILSPGMRFASPFLVNFRDAEGKLEDVIFNNTQVVSYQGDGLSANNNTILNKDDNNPVFIGPKVSNKNIYAAQKQLYVMLKNKGVNVGKWQDVTAEMAWENLGNVFWKTYRNDNDASFDSGFAVLLNAKKTQIQWSGSRATGANLNTTLFDSSIYTYVETTHGTGGGIYLERYDLSNQDNPCKTIMDEGTVTMGRHAESTVTAVPEDGYRVNRILIGDTNYGHGSDVSGLRSYTEYIIDGNDIKVDGRVVGSFDGSGTVTKFPELKTGVVELEGFYYDIYGDKKITEEKKILIERNADGTVDVTLPDIDNPMHVHADFGADYYFYKVWIDGDPVELNLTASPAGIYPTKVNIPVPTGNIVDGKPETQDVLFVINGNKYTAQNGTFKKDSETVIPLEGKVFTLATNNTLAYIETDSETGKETLAIRPDVVLLGNEFVRYITDPDTGEQTISDDERYPVQTEDRVADWESKDAKNFKVNNTSEYIDNGYVTVLEKKDPENTLSPGNTVWKIKYPSEGVEALDWPALPVEKEPSNNNHNASNHHERNYWFVIEEVPNWSTEGYSNENARVPGEADEYYKDAIWYANTAADKETGNKMVHEKYEHGNAYMSVFENGGEITNVPSIIVRGKKEWEDQNNLYGLRKDIWLHIDSSVKNEDGSVTKDVLPAQKVAANASGEELIKSWGTKAYYDTGNKNIIIAETVKKVPSNAIKQSDGSYKLDSKTYWVNELMKENADGKTYEYSIRETLDRDGNVPVNANDSSKGLIGYKSDDVAEWEELNAPKVQGEFSGKDEGDLFGQTVDRYNGVVKNTLDTVDFTVTKIWDDSPATKHGDDVDPAKLKAAYKLYDDIYEVADKYKLQPNSAEPYVKNGDDEYGTLEIKNGSNTEGKVTTTFTWHNIPKCLEDDNGGHEALYNIMETKLANYEKPVYGGGSTKEAVDKGTITNRQLPPTPKDDETWGLRGEEQTGKPSFEKGTADIDTIKLIDPDSGKPTDAKTVDALDENGKKIGTYTLNDNGTVTFKPNLDFVGDPQPAKLHATDKNGFEVDAKYQPHVIDKEETKTVKRKINYIYDTGEPVLDNKGNPLVVEQEVVYKRTISGIDPVTHEPIYQDEWTTSDSMDEVTSPNVEGWRTKTPSVEGITPPHNTEPGSLDRTIVYSKEPPKPYDDETWGGRGEEQTGEPTFEEGTAEIVTIQFIDPYSGEPTNEKTVDALDENDNIIGTYTLDDDGRVTFTPYADYVGTPKPATLRAEDKNGETVDAVYQPHVIDNVQKDTVKKTITHIYENGEPVLGDDGKPIVTEYELKFERTGKVDPETGEITWDSWKEKKFDDWSAPEIEGFTPHKKGSKGETVTPADGDKEDQIVYRKDTFTVTYTNGSNGKSDGKGDEKGVPYGDMVKGGNTVTPDPGYKFTGKYTYTITKRDGTVETGETDDPTSVKVTGDVVFTPLYEKLPEVTYIDPATGRVIKEWTSFNENGSEPPAPKNPTRDGYTFDGWDREVDKDGNVTYKAKWKPWKYTIKYDANGGKGTMDPQKFTSNDSAAESKHNEFTRDGYKFTGFKAKDPSGKYLKDKNGKELLFKDTKDFMEYLKKLGPDSEITLEAQWKKLPTTIYVDPATGRTIQKTLPFLDEGTEPEPPENPTRKGYKFVGWDRIEEYDENGDLVNVRYEAKWEKIESEAEESEKGGNGKSSKGAKTGDSSENLLVTSTILLSALLAALLMIKRRRYGNR